MNGSRPPLFLTLLQGKSEQLYEVTAVHPWVDATVKVEEEVW